MVGEETSKGRDEVVDTEDVESTEGVLEVVGIKGDTEVADSEMVPEEEVIVVDTEEEEITGVMVVEVRIGDHRTPEISGTTVFLPTTQEEVLLMAHNQLMVVNFRDQILLIEDQIQEETQETHILETEVIVEEMINSSKIPTHVETGLFKIIKTKTSHSSKAATNTQILQGNQAGILINPTGNQTIKGIRRDKIRTNTQTMDHMANPPTKTWQTDLQLGNRTILRILSKPVTSAKEIRIPPAETQTTPAITSKADQTSPAEPPNPKIGTSNLQTSPKALPSSTNQTSHLQRATSNKTQATTTVRTAVPQTATKDRTSK